MSTLLNERAFRQIEATHGGFLYQHLFAVGCLFLARRAGAQSLSVERDEDVELRFHGRTRYVQVKTRQRPLNISDLESTLQRFAAITAEHSTGRRPGAVELWVVSNTAAATALLEETNRRGLSIRFVTPSSAPPAEAHSPPAWPTLAAAREWCIDAASQIQFTGLSPETLTWKLATEVAFACTGARPAGHSFQVHQLSDLFEQFIVALHRLPAAPVPYIPQSSEPDLQTDARTRLIVGLSGAGKTAWVAQAALHAPSQLVYVDAATTPSTALASAIVQEVAAHFLKEGDATARDTILPGRSGLEALGALSLFAHDAGREVLIVCDNAHLMGFDTLRRVIEQAPAFRWTLIAQPFPDVAALEACFAFHSERLGGFSLEAIAAVFSDHGCAVNVTTANLIREMSGGLPLFVKDAARLTQLFYSADANRFLSEVLTGTHAKSTGQETILRHVVDRLSATSRMSTALLSIPEINLDHNECIRFLAEATTQQPASVAAGLRELTDWGIIQQYFTGSLSLHDAFRLSASALRLEVPPAVVDQARRSLASTLRASFPTADFDRLIMFVKLAPLIGESDTLVDITNSLSEYIQERGKEDALIRALEDASESADVDPIDRFWAYDTVTFWTMRDSPTDDVTRRVHQLQTLYDALPKPSVAPRRSLLMKQMLLAGRERDARQVCNRYRELSRLPGTSPQIARVQRYDYAVSLFHCNCNREARIVVETVATDYFREFALTPIDLFQTSVPRLAEKLGTKSQEYEELKRFADTLALQARILIELQFTSGLLRIWAHKLYALGQAPTSAVTVGLDVVDEMLDLLNDAPAARQFMENVLLPAVTTFGLLGHLLNVRATYAVVLAYCGEFTEAGKIMRSLLAFQSSPRMTAQLNNQQSLIDRIAQGKVRLTPGARLPLPIPALPPALRPGRNAACVCGSGLKLKRCCGR